MRDSSESTLPETWHHVDETTVNQVKEWIRSGHPRECEDRLSMIVEAEDLRHDTLRSMFLAHAIREHDVGLEAVIRVFDRRRIYGKSATFFQEAIRERSREFVAQVLDSWGSFSATNRRLAALGVILGAISSETQERAPPPSINQLAKQTGASFAWAHEVIQELSGKGWVTTADHLEVTSPQDLFEWWRKNRTKPSIHRYHVADPLTVASRMLHEYGIDHAITTYYAENAFQGHLFPRRFDAYVREEDLQRARETVAELGGTIGGTNFRLLTGDDSILDEVVTGQDRSPLHYAPLPQVILDLMTEGGSAREAADLLIERAYTHAEPSVS